MMVIKSASYFCLDKFSVPYCKANNETKSVLYYTFDGELITIMSYNSLYDMNLHATDLLDPNTPKPLVSKIQKKKFFTGKVIKDAREINFIFLLDKNGNIIATEEYYGSNSPSPQDLESYKDKYDLSTVPYYMWDHDGDIGPIVDVQHPKLFTSCIIL
jgi:hypothetical protein